jgi:glucokinase
MDIKWHNRQATFQRLVLAGDIGGTNTNLALVAETEGKFSLVLEVVFASKAIAGLSEPIASILEIARAERADLVPSLASISAAGPVSDNRCAMTNLSWTIDGDALARDFGLPVRVINDFLAISYGIPTLDVDDPGQIHPIHHPDGSLPRAQEGTKAVIGPGTGLGVSFLVWDGHRHIPASSEGGHIVYASFDDDSRSFRDYMQKRLGAVPGVEPLVSGTGIGNLYEWWRDTKGLPESSFWREVEALPVSERPRAVASSVGSQPVAAAMMDFFARLLGRFSGDVATLFLPVGGFYLAGGVAQKGLPWLEAGHAFAKAFEDNSNPNVHALLQRIPLYLIRDYAISLYGAANAGIQLG